MKFTLTSICLLLICSFCHSQKTSLWMDYATLNLSSKTINSTSEYTTSYSINDTTYQRSKSIYDVATTLNINKANQLRVGFNFNKNIDSKFHLEYGIGLSFQKFLLNSSSTYTWKSKQIIDTVILSKSSTSGSFGFIKFIGNRPTIQEGKNITNFELIIPIVLSYQLTPNIKAKLGVEITPSIAASSNEESIISTFSYIKDTTFIKEEKVILTDENLSLVPRLNINPKIEFDIKLIEKISLGLGVFFRTNGLLKSESNSSFFKDDNFVAIIAPSSYYIRVYYNL